jgi:hypothetical protein
MSAEKTLLIEALNATEEVAERTEDLGKRVEDTAGVAASAFDLADKAGEGVSELRREVASRWVRDNLDDQTVWCRPSVLDAAREVWRRSWETCGGPLVDKTLGIDRRTKAMVKHALRDQADGMYRDFLGQVVVDAATAAVAHDGFKALENRRLVVELESVEFADAEIFPRYACSAHYARR